MKGYITTCDGVQYELPTLLRWEFSYTGSVPCDSFSLRCPYEAAMAETLRRAVRFRAREDGATEFAGVIDETNVTCDEKGMQLELSGRGLAALLLDNEAEAVSYQRATMEEILKNHVTLYGIICTGYDAVTAASYRGANGSSQWKVLNDFAALHGGIEPYFDKTGALELKRTRRGASVTIDAQTPVTALVYCDKRYGVIAEALVVDKRAGARQSVKNADFCARRNEPEGILRAGEERRADDALHGRVSDQKVEGGGGDAACDDRGKVFRRPRRHGGRERDKARHQRAVPRDRMYAPLRRERRGERAVLAEGVRDDVVIEKAEPA